MAKAKKSEKPGDAAPAASAKKKAPAKPMKPAPAPGTPMIDTSLAAENAARMLAARAAGAIPAAGGDQKETALFKHMKENVARPHAASVDSLLNSTASSSSRKSAQPFITGGKQVGQNQTFGADVSRRNLPRRTGG
jgi:hypothetical protein